MNDLNIAHLSQAENPEFVAFIGLDWGDEKHELALVAGQQPMECRTLSNTPETLHAWLEELGQRFQGQPVALAVETSRGPLIHVFCAYPWLTIYPIHPATSAKYRAAFKPSGAKDDRPDAIIQLELLRLHRAKLRPLQPQEEATRQLAGMVELRRDAVDRRTQVLNQLTSLLKSYYPQALCLIGPELSTKLALDFLDRWPDPLALKIARPSTLKSFYYQHAVRSEALVDERLAVHKNLRPLTTELATLEPARMQLALLVAQLRVFQKHIAGMEKQIDARFSQHPEAELFRHLPGAGPALRPRLLVAFGEDRTLYPDPAALQKYVGVAPVVEKSGKQCWIHWRWRAPRFLRQTFIEWAVHTVANSAWAKAYYDHMLAHGKRRQVILRALAFKWIRILWKCWQTRTPYDEARYLAALARRKSPYAVNK
ncbi:MAG: IS110 family transposase [Verrucomicrobiota bacterium]